MSQFMLTPEQRIRQRYAWFEEAERLGNVTVACKRLGISRKTFYKWRKRGSRSSPIRMERVIESQVGLRQSVPGRRLSFRSLVTGGTEAGH